MTQSSGEYQFAVAVADFKGHEDQRMITGSEMNYTRARYLLRRTIIRSSINVLEVGVILVGSEIN